MDVPQTHQSAVYTWVHHGVRVPLVAVELTGNKDLLRVGLSVHGSEIRGQVT